MEKGGSWDEREREHTYISMHYLHFTETIAIKYKQLIWRLIATRFRCTCG